MYDPKPKVLTKVTVFIRLQGVSNSVFLTHAKLSCQSQQIFKVKASFLQNLFSPTTLVWKDFKSEKKLGGHSKGTDSWRKKKNEWHNLIQSNGDQKSCLKVQKTSLKMSRKIIKLKEKKYIMIHTEEYKNAQFVFSQLLRVVTLNSPLLILPSKHAPPLGLRRTRFLFAEVCSFKQCLKSDMLGLLWFSNLHDTFHSTGNSTSTDLKLSFLFNPFSPIPDFFTYAKNHLTSCQGLGSSKLTLILPYLQ